MSTPLTQPLTLKRIVEALDKIPNDGFGEKPPKMSVEQKKKLMELDKIVHPFVYQEWHVLLKKIGEKEKHAIVLSDIPLLFEGNMQHLFDLTILVLIVPEKQVSRLMTRNGISKEEAGKRLKSQMPIIEKIALADIVIDNDGGIPETEKRVRQVWRELLQKEKIKKS